MNDEEQILVYLSSKTVTGSNIAYTTFFANHQKISPGRRLIIGF
jgi:hypothetical protein